MSSEILAALIGAAAAILAGLIPFLLEKRKRRNQKYKFVYVRIVHLRRKQPGAQPVGKAFIKRVNREIEVFDEYHFFRLNIFHGPRKNFSCRDRTSGSVDLQILHPWQEAHYFSDKGAAELEDYIEQTVRQESSVFLTKSIYYNALQDGHEDISMKLEDDTDEARLMVDFSSLPAHEAVLLQAPVGYLRGEDEEQVALGVAQPYPGVYTISIQNGKRGQVVRMDIKIAWEKLGEPVERRAS